MKRFVVISLFLVFVLSVEGQAVVRLYPDDSSQCRKVTLELYPVQGSDVAVIVCPGGSYCWLDYENEGVEVAKFFQENGISAFVLRYRVAGWWSWFSHARICFRGNVAPDMYNDGQAALRWLRDNAAEYGLTPDHIGMVGFSAGGHLVLSQAVTKSGIKPAFVGAIYPVVTMTEECVHKRSRRGLLGERHMQTASRMDRWSIERQVTDKCPPVFLIGCVDDPVVDYRNYPLLDSSLTANNVPHFYQLFQTGGHGFGVNESKGSSQSREWKWSFLKWLKTLFIVEY